MKTLLKKGKIERVVSELNGYLTAVKHLNDSVGKRHHFYADLIYLNGQLPVDAIKQYLSDIQLNLSEINRREEMQIIEKFIFHNFLLGDVIENKKNFSFIKQQLIWHIQEYMELASVAVNSKQEIRWLHFSQNEIEEDATIFVKIKDYLIVMSFHFRSEV